MAKVKTKLHFRGSGELGMQSVDSFASINVVVSPRMLGNPRTGILLVLFLSQDR